jgi:predicted ATPase
VIEQRFPNVRTTEPEVLAHHLTEAGLTEAAVPLWQAAGELAFKRMAMAEAIAHLNRGLDLVATLPQSSQRDSSPFYSPDRGAGGVLSLGRGSPLRLFIATSERIWVGAGG